jgi:hypothetical protein
MKHQAKWFVRAPKPVVTGRGLSGDCEGWGSLSLATRGHCCAPSRCGRLGESALGGSL